MAGLGEQYIHFFPAAAKSVLLLGTCRDSFNRQINLDYNKASAMKDLFRSKYSLLFLILFIILLYVVLEKAILPFVMNVVESDVFFEEETEAELLGNVKNERTDFALMHCKNSMKEDEIVPENADFPDGKYDAWALGNRTYIIRSGVRVTDPEKGMVEKKFACKIRLVENDPTDFKNWSILGIDFHPEGEDE